MNMGGTMGLVMSAINTPKEDTNVSLDKNKQNDDYGQGHGSFQVDNLHT